MYGVDGWYTTNRELIMQFFIGKWSSPTISGTRPPPCNAFSFTQIDDHRAVLFGGRQHEGRTNDVYIFDMTRMVRFRCG